MWYWFGQEYWVIVLNIYNAFKQLDIILNSAHSQLAKCLHCLYQLRESLRFSKVGREAPTQCILCPKVGEPYSPGFLPYNGQELSVANHSKGCAQTFFCLGFLIAFSKERSCYSRSAPCTLWRYRHSVSFSLHTKTVCIFFFTYPRHSVSCSLHTKGILYLSSYIPKAFCIFLLTYPRHSVSFSLHIQDILYLSPYIPKAFWIFLLTYPRHSVSFSLHNRGILYLAPISKAFRIFLFK